VSSKDDKKAARIAAINAQKNADKKLSRLLTAKPRDRIAIAVSNSNNSSEGQGWSLSSEDEPGEA